MVVVNREMDGGWEWYNEMGQGNEWGGRVMEGKLRERIGRRYRGGREVQEVF